MRDQRRPTPHFHSIHKFVITKMDVTSPKDKILLKNGKFCTYVCILKFFKNMSSSQPQLFMLRICQDFNYAWPFWYGWVETELNGRNGQAKLKSCGHSRIKLKNVLWSGDLKASLRIASKKLIHKTSSTRYLYESTYVGII